MRPSEILAQKRDEVLAIVAKSPFTNPRLFGSVARGEDTEGSDLDLLVDNGGHGSLFDLAGLGLRLEELLGLQVDVFTPASLKDRVRDSAMRDQRPI